MNDPFLSQLGNKQLRDRAGKALRRMKGELAALDQVAEATQRLDAELTLLYGELIRRGEQQQLAGVQPPGQSVRECPHCGQQVRTAFIQRKETFQDHLDRVGGAIRPCEWSGVGVDLLYIIPPDAPPITNGAAPSGLPSAASEAVWSTFDGYKVPIDVHVVFAVRTTTGKDVEILIDWRTPEGAIIKSHGPVIVQAGGGVAVTGMTTTFQLTQALTLPNGG